MHIPVAKSSSVPITSVENGAPAKAIMRANLARLEEVPQDEPPADV